MDETPLVTAATKLLGLPGAAVWVWLGTAAATAVYVVGLLGWCWSTASWRERARRVVTIGLAAALADATSTWLVKPLVGRQRPCREDAGIHAVIEDAGARCGSGARPMKAEMIRRATCGFWLVV